MAATGTDVDILDALQACMAGRARLADDDTVAGVPARWVAEPGDTAQVASALRVAAERGLTVVSRGTGTRLSWGAAPTSVDLLLDLHRMDRVLEHEAGDLVVHVEAGARLDAVQSALASAGQHLALDPAPAPGSEHAGTVGGMIATAPSGPLRHSHGAVRDLLIGVTFVRADGVVAHAGGKVVKNVAGYDVGKLLTGSWGTLAVVTEARFRLHPVAPVSRWVTIPVADHARAAARVREAGHSQLAPAAVELDRPGEGPLTVSVQVAGTAAGVDARVAELTGLLDAPHDVTDSPPDWWRQLPWPAGGLGLRLTHELAGLAGLLDALDEACPAADVPRADVRGSAGVGVLHAGLRADAQQAGQIVRQLRAASGAWGGEVVVLDAPADVLAAVDVWGPVRGLPIMKRIKDQFDPEHRLTPGRFVGDV